MKSFIRLFFSFLFALTFLTSCNKEEKLTNQYIEACADGNFDKARAAVDKLAVNNAYLADEGIKYVNDKEIYYLLAKPSRENDNRIMYLYNTYEEHLLPNMNDVIDVAISMDNDNLPEKLIKAGVKPTEGNAQAAVNADMHDVLEVVVSKKPEVLLSPEVGKFYKNEIGEDKYKSALADLYKNSDNSTREKVVAVAKNEKFTELSVWTTELLEEKLKNIYAIKVPSRPALGMIQSNYYGKLPSEYDDYNREVSSLNSKITEFISEAVSYGQTAIANKALSYMKPTLESKVLGDWCKVVEHNDNSSVYNALQVSENRNDIIEAGKIIKNGL